MEFAEQDEVFRQVLAAYGLKRLTEGVRERLLTIVDIVGDVEEPSLL